MHHGGDLGDAMKIYGGHSEDWLDLSTGINPHAYSVSEPLSHTSLTRLPGQRELGALLAAARITYKMPEHLGVLAAPGTQILIAQLPHVLPTTNIGILWPTYVSHKDAFAKAGHRVTAVPPGSLASLTSSSPIPADCDTVLVVNPNNPDGRAYAPEDLLQLGHDLKARGGYLIVDEAFADVAPDISILPHLSPDDDNIIVLRSFGKFYGLAGLRLGFMIGPDELVSDLTARLESWSVSGPALEVGSRALEDIIWRKEMLEKLTAEMVSLLSLLDAQDLNVIGHTPLFVLLDVKDAASLHSHLAKHHIWSRLFSYSDHWLRLGLPGTSDGSERLTKALAEYRPRG
ncbi:MAG: threonine-phosphate decarboxylase [Rhodobacteraceae bacterium]|nr:threonine-phosphate decarboxylase [Paracoccaceae bacterium]